MRKLGAVGLALLMLASFGSVAMGQAQPAGDPAAVPTTRVVEHEDNGRNWGLLGLLGLVGLMGLRRREENTIRTTHGAASVTR
jgi:MYXO-CTERM domain-containing protein